MIVNRILEKSIFAAMDDQKAIIILGPRQAGKTTLLQHFKSQKETDLWLNGDESDIRTLLKNPTSTLLKQIIGTKTRLFIDEAQRIENIGLCIKIIVDQIPNVKVIATGSSAFELANKINEPLTGRKWEFRLLPLSFQEMVDHHGLLDEKRLIQNRLVYGYYPEIVSNPGDEKNRLKEIANSYLFKDILTWENIQKPDRLEKLVQALAHQVGQEVSYRELGELIGLDKETVERYIILLEKAYIIFRLSSLSRNNRNELKRSRKVFFYDNGLRNSVINNFNPIESRNDIGALWENFLVSERIKFLENNRVWANRFFWRTSTQQEIDYIEEREGKLFAFEFKWNAKAKFKIPSAFMESYPDSNVKVINQENINEFLLPF